MNSSFREIINDGQDEEKKEDLDYESSLDLLRLSVALPTAEQKMIVFDKDGTLGDCTASLRRWAHHMTERLSQVLPPDSAQERLLEEFHDTIGWDAASNDVTPSAPLAAGTWEDQVQAVHDFVVKYNGDISLNQVQEWHSELGALHGADAPLVPDLRGLLMECQRTHGYRVAICTSDDRAATDAALRHWNVEDVVEFSICGNEVSSGKPSPVPLQVLCREAGVMVEHCIVVGDTTADTGMARNAGVGLCVGVLTGSGTAEQLLESGAHMVLPHVGHVPGLLAGLAQLQQQQDDEAVVQATSAPEGILALEDERVSLIRQRASS